MSVLHVHEYGTPGEVPIFAVHGITAHGGRFRRLAEEAWPQRHTISVDLRGHGRSTYDAPWSIPQHVTDLLDTMDHYGLDTVDLVVHSYGGAIALALLAQAPDRIRTLVLLDPALAFDPADASENAFDSLEADTWATRDEAITARQGSLGPEHRATIEAEVEAHLIEDDGRFRFRYYRPAVVTGWGEMAHPLPAALPSVPTLLVVCDRAEIVTPAAIAGLEELLGEALTVEHLDCGHMLYWERFDDTAALINGFLHG